MGKRPQFAGITLTEQAISYLQRDILTGVLKPGTKLTVMDLSERYGIGATPLREALSRMISGHLVSSIGGRGFRVRELSYEDLRDITSVRYLIEDEALKLSMLHGGDTWESGIISSMHLLKRYVERMGAQFGRGDEEFDHLHHCFHAALIAGSGSARLSEMARELYHEASRYRLTMMNSFIDAHSFITLHENLKVAVLDRNPDMASKLLHDHLNTTLTTVYGERPTPLEEGDTP